MSAGSNGALGGGGCVLNVSVKNTIGEKIRFNDGGFSIFVPVTIFRTSRYESSRFSGTTARQRKRSRPKRYAENVSRKVSVMVAFPLARSPRILPCADWPRCAVSRAKAISRRRKTRKARLPSNRTSGTRNALTLISPERSEQTNVLFVG